MKLQIKKGAKVKIISGSQKGHEGVVLEINKPKMMVRVQGARMQTHFDKKDGISTKEGLIHYSNVKLVEQAAEKKPKKKAAARK